MSYNTDNTKINTDNSKVKPFARTAFEIAEAKSVAPCLNSISAIGYYLGFLTYGLGAGYAFAVFLDKKHRLLKTVKLKQERLPIPEPILDAIDSELEDKRVKYFFVAHNHKGKPLIPSIDDKVTTDAITVRYANSSAEFIGHYITSGVDYLLLKYEGTLERCYKPRRRTTK
ncbi:MAG: hypothetical protein IKM46_05485 [Clostridia bacterium]|nr:hypothetical protein [Clostridia bacterium]